MRDPIAQPKPCEYREPFTSLDDLPPEALAAVKAYERRLAARDRAHARKLRREKRAGLAYFAPVPETTLLLIHGALDFHTRRRVLDAPRFFVARVDRWPGELCGAIIPLEECDSYAEAQDTADAWNELERGLPFVNPGRFRR